MSSAENPVISKTVNRSGIPLLVCSMIGSTGVSVVLGCYFSYTRLGPGHFDELFHDYFWIIFWTGLSEGVALFTGLWIYHRLARRINDLQTELVDLTRAVLHDLKTPITHIRNSAEEMLLGVRPTDDALPTILESCDTLAGIINANAEISRAHQGDEPSSPEDLADIARTCVELYSDVATDKGVALASEIPATPIPLRIPKARLQHLVANLLDNAVKFTPAGGKVNLSLATTLKTVTLRVSDTGPGIPEDQQPRIFERFYRGDDSRHTPGFGLGLALVDAIVKSHHGRIAVDSAPGKGATFTISLPR